MRLFSNLYIKGGTSKTKLFFQFWTDFFKNWVLYAEFKKKTIGVEFFKIGPQLFEIFSFLCQKKWFFLIFARISKCISSYNFWARKKILMPFCSSTHCAKKYALFFSISISFSFYKRFCDSFCERSKNHQKCCFFHTFTMITRKQDRN